MKISSLAACRSRCITAHGRMVFTAALLLLAVRPGLAQSDYRYEFGAADIDDSGRRAAASRAASRTDSARDRDQQRQDQQRQATTLRGIVLRSAQVKRKDRDQQHLLVLLRTHEGFRRTVDLGPAQRWQDNRLRDGDNLAVTGPVVPVGDRGVLMANRARAKGMSVRIQRDESARRLTQETLRRAMLRGQQPSDDGADRPARGRREQVNDSRERSSSSRTARRGQVIPLRNGWYDDYFDWHYEWEYDPQTEEWEYESVFE